MDDRVCLCVCLILGDSIFARARGKGPSSTTGSVWSGEKGTGAGVIGHWTLRPQALVGGCWEGNVSRVQGTGELTEVVAGLWD